MQNKERKSKHLTLDDRIEIQECLAKGMTFKAIGKRIGKNQTTVSREVKLHLQPYTSGHTRLDEPCPLLLKAPFVCNGCDKKSKSSCRYRRQVYSAKKAQEEYAELLKEARSGVALSRESFYEAERIISAGVRAGQHIYHIIKANKLKVSTATVYRHIQRRYYSISALDLPRAVKFKIRKSRNSEVIPARVKKGRTYQDFLEFMEAHPELSVAELDTVIGRIGGKTIMTIHIVSCDFMFGLLLENKSAAQVTEKITALKQRLSSFGFDFGDLMPVFLTDNGGEFGNPFAFENDLSGVQESRLFFCEPSSPEQKPHIEKNHTLFRDILPKGSSFDELDQKTVDLIFSHVNAVKRKQFNGKSAFEMFCFLYSKDIAQAIGIAEIHPKDVMQSPKLLSLSSHS